MINKKIIYLFLLYVLHDMYSFRCKECNCYNIIKKSELNLTVFKLSRSNKIDNIQEYNILYKILKNDTKF